MPEAVRFQETWRIALELLDRSLPGLPHGWITGDDELGRSSEFRSALRQRGERYVLDVPCNTSVRDLERRRPRRKKAGVGRKREVPFVRADAWAALQPESRWERITVRDGEKGPLVVDAMSVSVRTKQDGRVGPEERLVVIRSVGESRIDYALSNAGPETPLTEMVRAQRQRHRIEEVFGAGKGEVGLDHYEVRSWVGWHHHMTLCLVALWFLCLERRRVGGENPGDHRTAGEAHPGPPAPRPAAEPGGDRPRGVAGAAAQRRGEDLPLAQGHRGFPPTTPGAEHELATDERRPPHQGHPEEAPPAHLGCRQQTSGHRRSRRDRSVLLRVLGPDGARLFRKYGWQYRMGSGGL